MWQRAQIFYSSPNILSVFMLVANFKFTKSNLVLLIYRSSGKEHVKCTVVMTPKAVKVESEHFHSYLINCIIRIVITLQY